MKKNHEYFRKVREQSRVEGRKRAKDFPKDYMYGCILYWTEGSKGKCTIDFVNTDVFMVKYFIGFLRKYFNCKNEKFSVYINAHLNNGLGLGDIEKYWLDSLDLPNTCLRKFTNRAKYYDSENSRVKSKHPYGVCKLRINDVTIVETIFGSIEEEFGIKINTY